MSINNLRTCPYLPQIRLSLAPIIVVLALSRNLDRVSKVAHSPNTATPYSSYVSLFDCSEVTELFKAPVKLAFL